MISDDDQFEDWIQSKITIAEDYLRASYSYMTYYNGDGEADESDWDDDELEGDEWEWDEVDEDDYDEDEESFEDDGMDVGVPTLELALDPNVDDDEIFESKKSKKK